MKKSEARIHIAKIIRQDDSQPNFGQLKMAEKILDEMKILGMKPPGYVALVRNGEKYNEDLHQGVDTFWCRDWEPEDDKI